MKCLDAQQNEPINQNLIKKHKVSRPTNKKRDCKALGTNVINSTMSPPFLVTMPFHGKSGYITTAQATPYFCFTFNIKHPLL